MTNVSDVFHYLFYCFMVLLVIISESKGLGSNYSSLRKRLFFFSVLSKLMVLCFCLAATILSCGWIIYLTYYNSRNIGLILTLIINRLYKDGYIHIGACSSGALSPGDE